MAVNPVKCNEFEWELREDTKRSSEDMKVESHFVYKTEELFQTLVHIFPIKSL